MRYTRKSLYLRWIKLDKQTPVTMEIQGTVTAVLPEESGTGKRGNDWKKRCFVVETPGQYPKSACLQLFGDKVADCPAVGESVAVSFDIESREYNGRWYTTLSAWKVTRNGSQAAVQAPPTPAAPPVVSAPATSDDLPF